MKNGGILATLMSLLCVGCGAQGTSLKVLEPADFKSAVETDKNAILIDIRTLEEYAQGHLEGAIQIDWQQEETFKQAVSGIDAGKTLYVYCRSGRRSNVAASYLTGKYNVVDMKGGITAWNNSGLPTTTLDSDVFFTEQGKRVVITFIKHGTLMIDIDGYTIHIDPVTMFGTDYSTLPKADAILVTHEHGDHLDKKAIDLIKKDGTLFLGNSRVAEQTGCAAMAVSDAKQVSLQNGTLKITATAAYNNTPGHENFHPKGRDVGYLLEVDDLRIYIAGDTEVIPELAQLQDIDIAFLPVNQPYTMTAEQCIEAIGMFSPKIVYPYHYGETDLSPIVSHFSGSSTEIRIKPLQ